MLRAELIEILRNGESSGVEFKRDDVAPDRVAKEIVALLNLRGGLLLLGVEDEGIVSGLTRTPAEAEQWVMNLCRNNIDPAVIPYWEVVEWEPGRMVGVVTLPADAPDRPYKTRRTTYIRVGTTFREATREEEARLYQRAGLVRYETRPVPSTELEDLDRRRLEDYFSRIRGTELPTDDDGWNRLLVNTELFEVASHGRPVANVAALVLFGQRPGRYLPQTGALAAAWPGAVKDYAAIERERITGPLVSLWDKRGDQLVERGVIDQVLDFVARNDPPTATLDGGVRVERRAWPEAAVREAVVNAFAHRDWSVQGTEVEVSMYSDRLEVVSPGALPNTITVDRMRAGTRYARNESVRDVLRDYRYAEADGLGVPRKLVRGMLEHNGTEPEFIADEHQVLVRLLRRNDGTAEALG